MPLAICIFSLTQCLFMSSDLFFFLAMPRSLQNLSFPTKDQTWAPAVRALTPNHWTAREFPSDHFKIRLVIFMILSCVNHVYSLDINPLSVISFANIFSYSGGCLFIFLMVSFAVKNFFYI